jgi:hypothetical protein
MMKVNVNCHNVKSKWRLIRRVTNNDATSYNIKIKYENYIVYENLNCNKYKVDYQKIKLRAYLRIILYA